MCGTVPRHPRHRHRACIDGKHHSFVKASKSAGPRTARRIPITIALEQDKHAFIESCVSLRQFDSVDEIFHAALSLYRRHGHALNVHAEAQTHMGYSRAEILESIECETLLTRAAPDPRRRKLRRWGRRYGATKMRS
jgi:Arc/MetJ-type ribon-helix-helix transcriptional regulator